MENSTYRIIDNISDVYASLLPDFFQQPFPLEDLATCDHCLMISDDKEYVAPEVRGSIHEYCIFHPDVKCCTYQPDLPNFLVGAILSSTSSDLSQGRKRIKEIIMQGEGVTPQSIQDTKSSSLEYSELIDYTSGGSLDIGCPYFDKVEKNCSIWLFRQANCSAFFCKSAEGIAGQVFWQTMNFYLSRVERQLSDYALQSFDSSTATEIWKQDKAEFYIKSYDAIKGLDSVSFEKICGASLDSLLNQVQESYGEATRSTVPGKLKVNPELQYEKLANSKYQYDTGHGRCVLSSRLHTILRFFDGKADNEQVMNRIVKEENVRLSSALLLRLYKNKILVSSTDDT